MIMRRFQDGGLNALDEEDPSEDDETVIDPEGDEDSGQPGGAVTSSGGLSALDIPGAQEAFTLMQKSAADARKALQQARESIMARQYSRADALLAASAALGAPTRSGSTAESFGNMAGALRGPLAARSAFDIQKQKDLLGVNTQLSGLDEREAQARLALAQLQAKLAVQGANAPNDKVIGPDGLPRYATRAQARGQQAWVPPGAQTNVNVSADKSLYGKMAEQLGEEYVNQYKAAQSAQNIVDRNQQIQDLLKANPFTGSLADWKLKFGKGAKALFGINFADDDITNTERLFSTLGNNVLESIHGSGLGTGNGFTDKDLQFLRDVKGGSITLDKSTIGYLSELADRTARLSTQKWNRTYGLLKPDLLKELGLTPVNIREPGPSGAAAAPAARPAAPAAPAAGAAEAANPDDAAAATWPPGAEAKLRANPTPEMKRFFIEKYGTLPDGIPL